MNHRRLASAVAAGLSFVLVTAAAAQTWPLVQIDMPVDVDSGPVANPTGERAVVYSTAVQIPSAVWVRLVFDDGTRLGATPPGGEATVIRVTSVQDGASQSLNARHLKEWGFTSAYLNGGVVLVEVLADAGAGESRVVMTRAAVGPRVGRQSICGSVDDRELSDDPRTGRLMPIGCTAWLFDDPARCFLTAGHCTGGGSMTMQFNVPLSDDEGNPQHPGPEDQYAVDQTSMQSNGGKGTGDDWAYFGCFANTETGLTPAQAQGDWFLQADSPEPVSDQSIRITGYGTTGSGVPRTWNQAQKTHTGPFVLFDGTLIKYETDTTGGNSGSPVIDETTGFAIGIHTHGGCNTSGGNHGTGSNHPVLRNAIANPRGVCVPAKTQGDVDGDGDVDFQDLVAMLAAWGPCAGCPEDLDGDGVVDLKDLLLVLTNWS